MKDRIKNLLLTIEEYDRLATHSRKLISDLSALQRELNSAEMESSKYQNENQTLNQRIAELKRKIQLKKAEVDQTTVKLEKFKDDLSAEYSVIRSLQEAIEEKENEISQLEESQREKDNANLSTQEILENEKEEQGVELIRRQAQIDQSQKVIERYKAKLDKFEAQMEAQNEKLIDYEQNVLMKLKSQIADLENRLQG